MESPLRGNTHGGFGERPGETDREQSRSPRPRPTQLVVAGVGSKVADPGLAERSTLARAEVGNRVINIDQPADGGGVGEDVGGVAELQLFAESGWYFVAVDWGVAGG
jgi:hypothetical protein